MQTNEQKQTGVRAADVELPPSMANVAQIPPRWLAMSDEGDELLVKAFDTAPQAANYRQTVREASKGEVDVVIMRTAVAFAAPSMLDYCLRRLARLNQLTAQHHKHGSARLAEKAELERILAGLIDPNPQADGVDATASQGGVE
jgi:hypothetical protein